MAVKGNISWDTIGPFVVWQFLIPMSASWIQSILYSIFIRAGDPKPQPGSPRFIRHRRQLLMAIYAAYFVFTIYEADFELQRAGNAYADLGVPINVDEGGLQSRFRKLTVRFHPDKVGPNVDREKANDFFVHLKHARDTILDPAKRFAYDRFGPTIFKGCTHCLTIGEFTSHSLLVTLYTYGALLIFLGGANSLGYFKDGAYWRYLALLGMATYEIRTALRPDHPTFLAKYLNPLVVSMGWRPAYLPFQATSIIRKAALSAAQFLGLLIPLYRDDPQRPTKVTEDSEEARHKQVDRLEAFVQESALDANRLLELESMPYRENEQLKTELRQALKRYMVQNVVHSQKIVRNAMGESLQRRRAGAPAGAKGTT
ncbi:hypothetical protein BU24DRAFT_420530 [Aaosphaeria arxii CBS 175.79]|uniref:J domain-containing protein n=1 Tax=Aaosphaeria arxii CBS 175.79 TaxID=1450172 RepID=A0A6A5XVY7_9PLEO|nr:uncharacterized protein BU24DRAFT_420530 [Aaosphaeria arxii CBS 175.79]KAF2017488.1 hypothetical protein BU24DRAFT_420530 [Aaosphaeria arxii CBS 175.79]